MLKIILSNSISTHRLLKMLYSDMRYMHKGIEDVGRITLQRGVLIFQTFGFRISSNFVISFCTSSSISSDEGWPIAHSPTLSTSLEEIFQMSYKTKASTRVSRSLMVEWNLKILFEVFDSVASRIKPIIFRHPLQKWSFIFASHRVTVQQCLFFKNVELHKKTNALKPSLQIFHAIMSTQLSFVRSFSSFRIRNAWNVFCRRILLRVSMQRETNLRTRRFAVPYTSTQEIQAFD